MLFAIWVQTGKEDETLSRIEMMYDENCRRLRPYQRIFAPKRVTPILRKGRLVDEKLTPLYPGYLFAETSDTWTELELAGAYGYAAPWDQMEKEPGWTEWQREIPKVIRLAQDLHGLGCYARLFLNEEKRWYVPLYSWEEDRLMGLLDDGYVLRWSRGFLMDPSCPGRGVVVTEGPLKGLEGELARVNRHKKTAVLHTSLCGTPMNVVVPLEVMTLQEGVLHIEFERESDGSVREGCLPA